MSEKHEFKAESKRLLDLMINSIYTNREIFLRELISNASDALDKLRFVAVSDSSLGIDTSGLEIRLTLDKAAGTLTVSDNGIGMSAEELSENLGVIAASGTRALKVETGDRPLSQNEPGDRSSDDTSTAKAAADLIGQFGVGFYSAFMVADHITVISRKYDSADANRWDSDGVDGYTVEPAERDEIGTDVILHIRPDAEQASPEYLREYPLYKLVKKYSDYIRYPIKMLMPHPYITNEAEIMAARMEAETAKATGNAGPEIPEPVYEEVFEYEMLNSMVPLWQKPRSEVTDEQYENFYMEHFDDRNKPLKTIVLAVEGSISYRAILYIPSKNPKDYATDDYKSGLELYSSNVLIMKNCEALIPEEFNFVRGVVDSSDLSLNISREMLQQDNQLSAIAVNISKKIRSELLKLLRNERETYEEFYKFFGRHLKVCALDEYGAKKDKLGELLLFYSLRKKALVTLDEYVSEMTPDQPYIYYVAGRDTATMERLPQTELVTGHNMDVLCFMDSADEFVSDMFHDYRGKKFKSVVDSDTGLDTEDRMKDTTMYKATLDFIAEALGSEVDRVQASGKLGRHPVSLVSGEGVTFEMEKYFKAMHKDAPIHAKRILELNVHHPAFLAIDNARFTDPERARKYARILFNQAKLIAGLPIEDPAGYTDMLVELFN